MKYRKKFLINLGWGFLVSSFLIVLSSQGYLKRVEAAGSDLLFRLRGFSSFNPSIVVIEITDDDLSS
ncbi:MAG TPA: hypothetical protein PKZ41_06445, partial [Candidatus Omnitrophota bacterium]|nr:hypothetical protein [Candidatus Omnitrophota bacterium]